MTSQPAKKNYKTHSIQYFIKLKETGAEICSLNRI